MRKYESIAPEKLETLAASDDAEALFETAVRLKNAGDEMRSRKFFMLAAQLGHGKAGAEMGKYYIERGETANAIAAYKKAFRRGENSVACELASLLMKEDENGAADVLIASAVSGSNAAVRALETYYRKKGDESEAEFWKEKRDERIKQKAEIAKTRQLAKQAKKRQSAKKSKK